MCTRLAAARDKVYQLLAQGRWFSPGILAFSTIKTGRHDIAEILLKVAVKHKKINQSIKLIYLFVFFQFASDQKLNIDIIHQPCTVVPFL